MRVRVCSLALLLLLQACAATRLVPLPDSAATVHRERRAISKRLPDLTVTVEAGAWDHRPRLLTDRVLPFLVEVENHSSEGVRLQLAEASLVDDRGVPRRPLWPDEAEALLSGVSDPWAIIPSLGIEVTGVEPTLVNLELGLNVNRARDLRDIRRLAFPQESIASGSQARGFVYFRQLPADARGLTLLLALDVPGARHQLSFAYAVER
jgi:hypothetical protein